MWPSQADRTGRRAWTSPPSQTKPPGGTTVAPPALTLTPAPTLWDPDDLTPPPYPDIAWWWQQLRP
jgi:hypothetical protein